MPSEWQSWMKHDIDAWCGSATVQDMTDAEYRAYHNLIMAQFQSEDGMLPDDDVQLAKLSRKRAEWSQIRAHVLEQFKGNGAGRIYNRRCYREWQEAQKMHASRKKGANTTNENRWANAKRPVSDNASNRSATAQRSVSDSSAGNQRPVNTVPNLTKQDTTEPSQERVVEPELAPEMVSQRVMTECRLSGRDLRMTLDDICGMEIRGGRDALELAETLIARWLNFTNADTIAQLEYRCGAAKFFGEGWWQDEARWPWRDGANGDGTNQQQASRKRPQSAAQQRHSDAMRDIADAFADVLPDEAGQRGNAGADGPDEGELRNAGAAAGMGRTVPITLDGHRAAARDTSASRSVASAYG